MQVKILGSAAGGAFPQWNCACSNCAALRAGSFHGKPRSQTQVAISRDGGSWFLLGASPDLRAQIESTPELHPRAGLRQSPIAGVVLANADVDHTLGLLLMRELQPLRVHATASVCRILREDNSMFNMLNRVPKQIEWSQFGPQEEFLVLDAKGLDSGIRCRPWSLSPHYPAYVGEKRRAQLEAREASLGFILSAAGKAQSGGANDKNSLRNDSPVQSSLGYFPAVPEIDDALLEQLEACDLVLFDGTFWSDDELISVQGSGQSALQMGHVPVEITLRKLAGVRRPRKIFLHINNTNPMLDEASAEFRQVRAAGWEIAEDGWQFNL